MAIVKLQNGKVLLKDGKVSCSCCAPVACCMYPAQGLVDGLYTVDDLPDEIIVTKASLGIYNEILTKTGAGPSFYEGEFVGNLLSVKIKNVINFAGEEKSVWILVYGEGEGEEFGLSSRPECLLVSDDEFDGSYDTFAHTYTISGGPRGAITVTRVSLCLWEGTDPCGNSASLVYLEDPANGKLWFVDVFVDVPNYSFECAVFDVFQGENIGFGNTPVGSYGNFPYEGGFLFVS